MEKLESDYETLKDTLIIIFITLVDQINYIEIVNWGVS